MIKNVLLVLLGGGIGSVLRYLINILIVKFYPNKAYVSTFIVNVIGCFIIGVLIGLISKNNNNEYIKLVLITGFCGGFTTFSSFGLENYSLIHSGNLITSLVYMTMSISLGILFVCLGIYLAR